MFEFIRSEQGKAGDDKDIRRSNGPGLASESPEGTRTPRAAMQITVPLAAKSAADLGRIVSRTHLSQADILNRAVSLYEFIDSELTQGAELIVRKDGQDHVIKLM